MLKSYQKAEKPSVKKLLTEIPTRLLIWLYAIFLYTCLLTIIFITIFFGQWNWYFVNKFCKSVYVSRIKFCNGVCIPWKKSHSSHKMIQCSEILLVTQQVSWCHRILSFGPITARCPERTSPILDKNDNISESWPIKVNGWIFQGFFSWRIQKYHRHLGIHFEIIK